MRLMWSAAVLVERDNLFNPVVEYLDGMKWDGIESLEKVPDELLNVPAEKRNPLFGVYFKRWAISAVARAFQPGCKVDGVLVLDGPQGTYKSSFFRVLGEGPGEGYVHDSPVDVGRKDGMEVLQGTWIIEWAEFEDLMRSRTAGAMKAFITCPSDRYRPSYGAFTIDVPRRCAIGATTNVPEVCR